MTDRTAVLNELKAFKASGRADYLVIIPTYNEAENIKELIERIHRDVKTPVQILVIDDGSPDGTAKVATELAKNLKGISILERSGKMGLGSAYLAGFALAEETGFPFVITMDSDLSHDPIVINDMIAKSASNDLVIGSRYCPGGKIPNFELWRRWMSKGGNLLAKTLLGIKAMDCTSGYRCYRTSVFKTVDPAEHVQSRQYIFLVEYLMHLTIRKCRIAETPITFNQRTRGKTKVSFEEFYHGLERIFYLAISTRLLKRHKGK
jgi:dolichol-phosphate mannosyltransferase